MTEREIEHITGTVGGITQRGEQWVVEVTPQGSKYAKKCRTKSEDVRATAASLYGQVATFECGVSHGEYEGKPVRYFWINAVNPGVPPQASEPVAATASPQRGNAGATPKRDDPTRDSIEKQVALKCATQLHAGIGASAADVAGDVLDSADRFFAFLQGTALAVTTERDAPNENDVSGDSWAAEADDIPF